MSAETSEQSLDLAEQIRGKSVEIVRIGLSDQAVFDRIPRSRVMFEYASGGSEVLPPPSLHRGLLVPACIDRLKVTGETLKDQGIKNLGLFIAKHNLPYLTEENRFGKLDQSVPCEVGVSYTYEDEKGNKTRTAGSPVLSVLHALSRLAEKVPTLTPARVAHIINYHFGTYLTNSDHEVTVIAMPPRREESPTHKALIPYAVPHPLTDDMVEHTEFGGREVDLYFFAHGHQGPREVYGRNIQKAEELMVDLRYTKSLIAIDSTWNDVNFHSEEAQRPPSEDMFYSNNDRREAISETNNVLWALIKNTPFLQWVDIQQVRSLTEKRTDDRFFVDPTRIYG